MIWPLRTKLMQPVFMQQRMKAYRHYIKPAKPVNKPWNAMSARIRGVYDVPTPFPSVVHQLLPMPAHNFRVYGVTKDSTGAILGSCTVKLHRTSDGVLLRTTTSDATTGAYEFSYASPFVACYIVAYLAGSPDLAGTTVNTITGL